ncbi:MAG: helix-turn-helix domain-containing protein [Undibacterium sp.]|nr:helix-turn-helix domain-containing protein [Opitutaceae bacterium]
MAQSGRFSVTDLCEQFGINRKTGYKHLERYAELGLAGLQPRSHRPHRFPQRTDEDEKRTTKKGVNLCTRRSRLNQPGLGTDFRLHCGQFRFVRRSLASSEPVRIAGPPFYPSWKTVSFRYNSPDGRISR